MVAAQLGVPAAVGVAATLRLAASRAIYLNMRHISLRLVKTLLRRGRLFAALQLVAIMNFEFDNLIVARILGPTKVTEFAATTAAVCDPALCSRRCSLHRCGGRSPTRSRVARQPWVSLAYRRSTLAAIRSCCCLAAALRWCLGAQPIRPGPIGQSPTCRSSSHSRCGSSFTRFNQPQAMLLNALHVERFQIRAATANLAVNLSLSIVFTHEFGVSGPIWGTLVAQVTALVIRQPSTLSRVENGRCEAHAHRPSAA